MGNTYGHKLVVPLTNKSGGGVIAGDVVIIDTANNDSFTTTTAGGYTGLIGVAQETIANNAVGRVAIAGYVPLVNVNASVTRGNYGKTHTVAKQATDAGAARVTGTFCQFLTGGTSPTAHLFGFPDGAVNGSLTDHTHAATGSGATGGGSSLAPATLSVTGRQNFAGALVSTVNADQNDFNPTDLHNSTSIRFTSFSAQRTVTGIHAGTEGDMLILINNTSFSLLLPNESASSAASARFRTANSATVTVRSQGSVLLFYLGGRWTVIGA